MKWIILKEDEKGKIVVLKGDLTKKMKELWGDEALASLAEQTKIPLVALKEMPWIAFIKSDIANKDIQGYKQHKQALKNEGFDV